MLVLIERQNQSSCIVGSVIDFSFHVNFNALLYPSQFVGFNVDTSSNDYVSRAKLKKFYTIDRIYKIPPVSPDCTSNSECLKYV